jgi:hypothetical protein
MKLLLPPTEKQLLDYVNKTPKEVLNHCVNFDPECVNDTSVEKFVALCQQALEEIPVNLRGYATVQLGESGLTFNAHREETSAEHVERCRAELNASLRAKYQRYQQYVLLKREFGNA